MAGRGRRRGPGGRGAAAPEPRPAPAPRRRRRPGARETSRASRRWSCAIGYGAGEEVADGPLTRGARAAGAARARGARRSAALRPQERLAALLSGRDAALACEELALRARGDLDAGRSREAALGLRPALEAALAELEPWAERGDLRARIGELAGLREDAGEVYARALERGLDEAEAQTVDACWAASRPRCGLARLGDSSERQRPDG